MGRIYLEGSDFGGFDWIHVHEDEHFIGMSNHRAHTHSQTHNTHM